MSERIADFRRVYARRVMAAAGVADDAALERAFATVPREAFLGPGPWRLKEVSRDRERAWTTPDDDPVWVYDNVLVAIDEARDLNNGMPDFHAINLHALAPRPGGQAVHVGAGTGYYTAILAALVGAAGRVTAVEIDPRLAGASRRNLSDRPNVAVLAGDGNVVETGAADAIYVNAGATHPAPGWLDNLRDGGRLVLPLTAGARNAWGRVLAVERGGAGLAARFLGRVGIYPCIGGRDDEAAERLGAAFGRGGLDEVRSLRRDAHAPVASCWLHGPGFCLSVLSPGGR